MKYLYQTRFLQSASKTSDFNVNKLKYLFFLKIDTNVNLNLRELDYNVYSNELGLLLEDKLRTYNSNLLKSNEFLINSNVLSNKLICYSMKQGSKLKAYNIYSSYMSTFFSFFHSYNPEINDTYPLYSMYFEYAQKNKTVFFSPTFIYKNIVGFLEPSFILTVVRRKKKKQIQKELKVSYLNPSKRVAFSIKIVNMFSKTYNYRNIENSKCYGLLNTFLSNRNSQLYKKKIYTYNKLLQQKKLNK